ncbi:MAG: hypothetical protein M1286_01415 [Candidatus Marsarchaeota archaeon]|nr:hypothetical protein [Candidatus Marsarchaeota archaeon]
MKEKTVEKTEKSERTASTTLTEEKTRALEAISADLRRGIYETVKTAGSGHLGGTSSSVELMTVLYFGDILKYDIANPGHPDRDRVLVRGHLGPLRYNLFALLGWVREEELRTYRQLGSRLQGHESMELVPGVDITPSGSLGMVLSYGVGSAYAAKNMGKSFKTYIFLGDGEEEEGNVSEAARHAGRLDLDNIVCIIDKNEKQLSRPTRDVDGSNTRKMWEAYGWEVREIKDGNSVRDVHEVLSGLDNINRPTLVIAHTIKGKGLGGAEGNCCGYHTISSCPPDALAKAIEEQGGLVLGMNVDVKSAAKGLARKLEAPELKVEKTDAGDFSLRIGEKKGDIPSALKDCTRLLAEEASRQGIRLYVMTADMLRADTIPTYGFGEKAKYIDVGLREQHLFAMAHGISQTDSDSRIVIFPGEQFMYRAADQLNAMAQARTKAVIIVTKCGLSDNHNGSTHQSVGQPGMFLTMPGLNFFEPADATDLYGCMDYAFSKYPGLTYIRLNDVPIKPLNAEKRSLSWYVADKPQARPDIVFVASGFPVSKAVEASAKLNEKGITAKTINVVNPMALDEAFVSELEPGKPVLTLYNGHPDVLKQKVAAKVMEYDSNRPSAIVGHGFELGTSGKLNDLLRHFKLDADGIAGLAESIVSAKR